MPKSYGGEIKMTLATKFSWEVPLAHLKDFDGDQDYIFSISFLYEHSVYRDYILNRPSYKQLILDNSYNELGKSGDALSLSTMADDYGADYTICPDDESWSTQQWISSYTQSIVWMDKNHLLAVPKNNNECVYAHVNNIAFALPYRQRSKVKKEWLYKAQHFLGLNNHWECYQFKPRTCDTSMPIKLAMKGKTIKDWITEGLTHPRTTPDYFSQHMTTAQIDLAKQNIQTIRECTNGTKKL
jgi:hypothetical protein